MADNQFISNSTVTYDIASDGTTTVTHDITLQNKTSDFYATSYTLSLSGINPIDPVAFQGYSEMPLKQSENNGETALEVTFPDPAVGKDSKTEFSISFKDKTLVAKSGEIWEITTPKLADSASFDFYSTIIKVPTIFGQLAYVSPEPTFKSSENGKMIFSFDKAQSIKVPITAAFGNFQVFSFNLNYTIQNPLNSTATTDIALPPDTNYQKMSYTSIDPAPTKVSVDTDGNWIATFTLKAKEQINVAAQGAVQIFPNQTEFPKINASNVNNYLGASQYWQTNDPKIKELAAKYKTPKAIYDYVSSTLTYDYDKIAPDVKRLGAVAALNNPTQAICTEFTDLFIAIARAAGIPAREIEGYAYTENPQVQPLSLVADVLHAWPEYWDSKSLTWIPVDPTWGSTSGIDFFNKLDLRHFAFVIHGADSTKPYPAGSYKEGTNPQKDVRVSFGQLPAKRTGDLKITNKILSELPFSDELFDIKVFNPGPTAIYNAPFKVMHDNVQESESTIDVIPPYGYYDATVRIPYSFLGEKVPTNVEIAVNSNKSEFGTYKLYVTISNLLMLALFIFSIIFLIYLRFKDAKAKKLTS